MTDAEYGAIDELPVDTVPLPDLDRPLDPCPLERLTTGGGVWYSTGTRRADSRAEEDASRVEVDADESYFGGERPMKRERIAQKTRRTKT